MAQPLQGTVWKAQTKIMTDPKTPSVTGNGVPRCLTSHRYTITLRLGLRIGIGIQIWEVHDFVHTLARSCHFVRSIKLRSHALYCWRGKVQAQQRGFQRVLGLNSDVLIIG